MRRVVACVLVVLLVHAGSGCGTVISGTRQDLNVTITPRDSQVTVQRWNGEVVGGPAPATTGTLEVHRPEWNQPYLVYAYSPGHCPQYWLTKTKPSTGAWFILPFVVAIAVFPVAGLLVTIPLTLTDNMTGGCCSVEPSTFDGVLMEDSACAD